LNDSGTTLDDCIMLPAVHMTGNYMSTYRMEVSMKEHVSLQGFARDEGRGKHGELGKKTC
jgi:hypothetical protein